MIQPASSTLSLNKSARTQLEPKFKTDAHLKSRTGR